LSSSSPPTAIADRRASAALTDNQVLMNPAAHSSEPDQADVTRRYNRMARIYDLYDAPMEMMGTKKRRHRLLSKAEGSVIEAGIGTGRNLRYYPAGVEVTGVDVSSQMLGRAEGRTAAHPVNLELVEADVQHLPFDDDTFDTAVGTCVFCSVANPVRGLQELGRVVRPDGRILLLEHVRPNNKLLGRVADAVSILTRRIFGFRTNRRTGENVAAAGLEIIEVTRRGVWRQIVAKPARAD
jgi:ubiquinone/menaquinone biosynthesis C-methylase UbiE